MCLQKILNVPDGPMQIWIKVLTELDAWYFVLANGVRTLARITERYMYMPISVTQ